LEELSNLIYVVGSTATGKSSFSLQMAEELNSCIVNFDSVQVYKHVNIGTAKPTKEEMKVVPHHLFDFVESNDDYTAGRYFEDARKTISEIDNKNIFMVGGSGFYLNSFEYGLFDVDDSPEELEAEAAKIVEDEGLEALYKKLLELDPKADELINENDTYRVKRTYVMLKSSGKPLKQIRSEFEESKIKNKVKNPSQRVGLYIERDHLRKLIRERVGIMVKSGLVEEVEALLAKGLEDWQPMKSVGYKEVVRHLKGDLTLEEMVDAISISTGQLAKRQMTWFKRFKETQWFHALNERDKARDFVLKFANNLL